MLSGEKYRFKAKAKAATELASASCKSQPNLRRPQLLAEEEEDKSRSRTVGRLLGRLSHPSNRAKKIRQILAGRDMGHEEEIEGRTDGRTNRWPRFSLWSLFRIVVGASFQVGT